MSARRAWAWPLVPLYGAALAAKDAVRASGLLPQHRLGWPVISVGSVSAGGAGKTPVVMALCALLRRRHWAVDVLSRGYGRAGSGVERVDAAAADAARRFGDEPVLIAERTGVPVWVGSSRYAAGRAAEREPSPIEAADAGQQPAAADDIESSEPGPLRAHILDDGLQHRTLDRQFELAVVTEADLRDTLLPAGNLREPLSALRRAHAFAVREEEVETVSEQLHRLCGREVPVWTLRRHLAFPAPLGVFGAGLRPLAFCALARPESFAAMLASAGCGLVDTVVFPDHHLYTPTDVLTLIRVGKQMTATGLVTTEKDAVKLPPAMRQQLEAELGPLVIVRLEAHFVYESPVMRTLEARLRPLARAPEIHEERVR